MLLVRSVSFNTPVNKVLREVVAAMQGWDHNKHTWPMRISTLPAPRTARFPRPKPKQQSVIKWAPHCSLVGSRTGHAWMWWCHASWGYPSTLCVTFLASSLRWRPLWQPVVAGGKALSRETPTRIVIFPSLCWTSMQTVKRWVEVESPRAYVINQTS